MAVQNARDVFELNHRVTVSQRIRASEHDKLRCKDRRPRLTSSFRDQASELYDFGASDSGGKLAREVKAADMYVLQATIY